MKNFIYARRKFLLTDLSMLVILVILILSLGCKKEYEVVDPETPFEHKVSFNYEYDISGMNDTMNDALFTVDIVLFHSDHLSMSWAALKNEFMKADDAFRAEGVQLNLKKAVNVSFPDEWNNLTAYSLTSLPDSGQTLGFYDKYSVMKPIMNDTVKTAFTDFIYDEPNKTRTIFILPMSGVKIIFAEQNTNGSWQMGGPVATGALSFPGYILLDGISKNLRGCITMQSATGRTLAHELGHKLINVSHEGQNVSPAFSGNTIPGLLGYGTSVEIFGGQSGRWHKERLLLSPYLYKKVNGSKKYNPDYAGVGAYDDAIYGGFVMPQ
jgi:hypothetical protein